MDPQTRVFTQDQKLAERVLEFLKLIEENVPKRWEFDQGLVMMSGMTAILMGPSVGLVAAHTMDPIIAMPGVIACAGFLSVSLYGFDQAVKKVPDPKADLESLVRDTYLKVFR